jgi:hypothetical protein
MYRGYLSSIARQSCKFASAVLHDFLARLQPNPLQNQRVEWSVVDPPLVRSYPTLGNRRMVCPAVWNLPGIGFSHDVRIATSILRPSIRFLAFAIP